MRFSTRSERRKLEAGEDDQKANTTKLTWKKLKSRKKYYFKIQAYKIVGGKKYSGKYSKIRSVKVK